MAMPAGRRGADGRLAEVELGVELERELAVADPDAASDAAGLGLLHRCMADALEPG